VPRPDPLVRRALLDAVPLFIPAVPFAMVLGVEITESQIPSALGWSTNVFIFAGAAQLATVTLAGTATWLTLVATAAVINLRHLMYSVALSPRFGRQPTWFRWLGPYVLIDQTFALVSRRDDLADVAWRRYYLTVGFFFWSVWMSCVTLGMLVGSAIPESWRLDVAPAVMFTGLVVIGITSSPGVVAATVGAGVSLAGLGLPHSSGILVGALSGVVAGVLAETVLGDGSTRPDDPDDLVLDVAT
jgi:predicted branched-subunit amino acid permease